MLNKEKTEGTKIRSRAIWAESGEKNTKYFLNLEKRQGQKKAIYRIFNESNLMITDQELILDELVLFYRKLYKKTTLGLDRNWLKCKMGEISIPTISENQRKESEKTIQGHECL